MCFFFFNDTATTEIYTLSLHDALPISKRSLQVAHMQYPRISLLQIFCQTLSQGMSPFLKSVDRKSTRLNSSHANISYAVFCLKKKKSFSSAPTRYYNTPSALSPPHHLI